MATLACFVSIGCAGCSSLGLSLYPSGEVLTKEAEAVLDSTRIPSGLARENAKTVLPPHLLQPGDAVLIEPIGRDSDLRLPADQTVLADGSIDLGAYGRTVVAGSTLEQAESLIEQQIAYQLRQQADACKRGQNATDTKSTNQRSLTDDCDGIAVNVQLLEPVHSYYVLGEVNAPGSYPLTGSETVLDAIVNSGGLAARANPCKILLARPTDPCEARVTLPVCYREIVQIGNTATNYQLQPGDRVFVASRSCVDEVMFWRADNTCSRCAGCNRPSRSPECLTTKPLIVANGTMIAPGSTGRKFALGSPRAPSAGKGSDQVETSPWIDTEPSDSSLPTPANLDGELDFSMLPD